MKPHWQSCRRSLRETMLMLRLCQRWAHRSNEVSASTCCPAL
jgi:hypothetical protein